MKHIINKKEANVDNSEYMIASEVARLKGVTPAAVRAWELRGILPAKRTATGTRIFARSDVEKFQPPQRRK
jgi:predicted site-specific integrase-resolvase